MRTGAFLMIDALGFKGIWKRSSSPEHSTAVIEKLVKLQRETTRYLDRQFGGPEERTAMAKHPVMGLESIQARFLSDTIVCAIAVKESHNIDLNEAVQSSGQRISPDFAFSVIKASAVKVACRLASAIAAIGASTAPALAYRGCVSFGGFEVHDNFLVGPAVDDAASANSLAQGAFIWLLPSAFEVMEPFDAPSCWPETGIYLPYDVPLKGGDTYRTLAVSPFALAQAETDRDSTVSSILRTFTGDLDIQVKKQNTVRFLDACVAQWAPPPPHSRGAW